MIIEQKIKEIEGFVKGEHKYSQYDAATYEFLLGKLNQALEVIREQQKQLDRVRNTETFSYILHRSNTSNYYTDNSVFTVQELQNYILGGGENDNS